MIPAEYAHGEGPPAGTLHEGVVGNLIPLQQQSFDELNPRNGALANVARNNAVESDLVERIG